MPGPPEGIKTDFYRKMKYFQKGAKFFWGEVLADFQIISIFASAFGNELTKVW